MGTVVQTEFVSFLPSVPPLRRTALGNFAFGIWRGGAIVSADMVWQSAARKPLAADGTGIASEVRHEIGVPYLHDATPSWAPLPASARPLTEALRYCPQSTTTTG